MGSPAEDDIVTTSTPAPAAAHVPMGQTIDITIGEPDKTEEPVESEEPQEAVMTITIGDRKITVNPDKAEEKLLSFFHELEIRSRAISARLVELIRKSDETTDMDERQTLEQTIADLAAAYAASESIVCMLQEATTPNPLDNIPLGAAIEELRSIIDTQFPQPAEGEEENMSVDVSKFESLSAGLLRLERAELLRQPYQEADAVCVGLGDGCGCHQCEAQEDAIAEMKAEENELENPFSQANINAEATREVMEEEARNEAGE